MYRLIIFDWDGTLIDSAATIVDCFQRAAAEIALPALEEEKIRNIIGLGLREAITSIYPDIEESQIHALREGYSKHFIRTRLTEQDVFPNVVETLDRLHGAGLGLAVATGKSRRGLRRAFEHIDWDHYFHATRCADETRSKPHPQMLHELLDELQVPPEAALMVGDTEYDMEMATNAGMDSVAVNYGVHSEERLASHAPKLIVNSISEIADWLAVTSR